MAKITWVFQNESGTNLNRYKATNVATNEEVVFDLLRDGNISVVGTPLNATNMNSLITSINSCYDDLSSHVNNASNPHNVTKAQIGLGNCDNTSDISKPISTATQNALNGKVPTTRKINGKALSGDITLDSSDVGAFKNDITFHTNIDLNTLIDDGVYSLNGPLTNAPSSDIIGVMYVKQVTGGSWLTQMIVQNSSTNDYLVTQKCYVRCRANDTWGSWKELINSSGGTVNGNIRIDNSNSAGYIELFEDGEGGNIDICSPNGVVWEIDAFDDNLRIFNFLNGSPHFFNFGRDGNFITEKINGGTPYTTANKPTVSDITNLPRLTSGDISLSKTSITLSVSQSIVTVVATISGNATFKSIDEILSPELGITSVGYSNNTLGSTSINIHFGKGPIIGSAGCLLKFTDIFGTTVTKLITITNEP